MLKRSKAQQYLLELQEKTYSRMGMSLEDVQKKAQDPNGGEEEIMKEYLEQNTDFFPADVISKMKANMKQRLEDVAKIEVPTPYEDPSHYQFILGLAHDIEEAARVLRLEEHSSLNYVRPIFGTLPTGKVNAMTIAVPSSDDYLVVFESELFTFCYLVCKAIAQTISYKSLKDSFVFSTKQRDMNEMITRNKKITERFQEVIVGYLAYGRPSVARPYLLEEPYFTTAMMILRSMELFILGHEYAHILNGHLKKSNMVAATVGGQEINEVSWSWEQELAADRWGLQLMLVAIRLKWGFDAALSYWGADFFFTCFDILERGKSILRTGKEDWYWSGGKKHEAARSHPPAKVRQDQIRQEIRKQFGEGPVKLGMSLERATELLWERTSPKLVRYYETGRKFDPRWKQTSISQ